LGISFSNSYFNTVGHTGIYVCGEKSSGLNKYNSSETILYEARKRKLG
jgi:hypothetical protein